MKRINNISIFFILMITVVMTTGCASLNMLLGGSKYDSGTVALEALVDNNATYDDLALADQWGLVWNGMFSSFSKHPKMDFESSFINITDIDTNYIDNLYRDALRKAFNVRAEQYDSFTDMDGKTSYYYRVNDKKSLEVLAKNAIELLYAQDDPSVAIMWMEDFYTKLDSIEGKYNGFALCKYRANIDKYARYLFEIDEISNNAESLLDDSKGALAAKAYLEKYPAGIFIQYAKDRLKIIAGTEAELIL